jgi:hypothetical protein
MPKSKPAFIEVKCPKCGKQFNSEEKMLEHHENCTAVKHTWNSSKKKVIGATVIAILVLSMGAGIFALDFVVNKNPAHDYALSKGISHNVSTLNQTWAKDDGVKEKAIIDYASQLDSTYRETFLNSLLSSTDIIAQYHQVQFLSSLNLDKQLQIIDEGKAGNFDLDDDGMNNYFEQNVAILPYYVYNGRYALLVDTADPATQLVNVPGSYVSGMGSMDLMYQFLTNEQKFDASNIVKLRYMNATLDNFKQALVNISKQATNQDIVFVAMSSHGGQYSIGFYGGGTTYKEIDAYLDQINSKATVITVFACSAETGLAALEDGPSPRIFMTISQGWFFGTSPNFVNSCSALPEQYNIPKNQTGYDSNQNGWVSIKETWEANMNSQSESFAIYGASEEQKWVMSDTSNISANIYLGDFEVSDKSLPPYL